MGYYPLVAYVSTYVNSYVTINTTNVRAFTQQNCVRQQMIADVTTLKANITQSGGYVCTIDDIDDSWWCQ